MKNDLKDGKSDGIIMLNGIEKYIYYTPLDINDWYEDKFNAQSRKNNTKAFERTFLTF